MEINLEQRHCWRTVTHPQGKLPNPCFFKKQKQELQHNGAQRPVCSSPYHRPCRLPKQSGTLHAGAIQMVDAQLIIIV